MARVLRPRPYPRTELIRVVQPRRLLQTTQLSASIPRHLLLRNGHPRSSSSITGSIREQTTARKLQIKLLRRVLASPPAYPSCSSSFSPSPESSRRSVHHQPHTVVVVVSLRHLNLHVELSSVTRLKLHAFVSPAVAVVGGRNQARRRQQDPARRTIDLSNEAAKA
ncbi:hypothetical protein DY000_02023109 [Brassica cretica]|uniref:Uncharacterized protein n=1 Tax=Brassica cretica TaxID=69181 RepID=A0ABQ7EBU9_BRACR|nr:hypothetical protein DY000_02023109 [Brassica cretica]